MLYVVYPQRIRAVTTFALFLLLVLLKVLSAEADTNLYLAGSPQSTLTLTPVFPGGLASAVMVSPGIEAQATCNAYGRFYTGSMQGGLAFSMDTGPLPIEGGGS